VFLLFTGLFALIWICYIVFIWKLYDAEVDQLQYSIEGFNTYAWLPLWLAAFMAGWGSFYTAPGALDQGGPFGEKKEKSLSEKKQSWRPKWLRFRFFSKPILINVICIGSGPLIAIALVVPTILSQNLKSKAFNEYLEMADQINQLLSTNPGQADAPALLQQASSVWDDVLENQWYLTIGYIMWTIFASAFLMFYIPSGGYL